MSYPMQLKTATGFQERDRTTLTPLTISIKNMFSKGLKYSQSIPNLKDRAEHRVFKPEAEFEIANISHLAEKISARGPFDDHESSELKSLDIPKRKESGAKIAPKESMREINTPSSKPKPLPRTKNFRILSRLFTGDISIFKLGNSSGSINSKSKKVKITANIESVLRIKRPQDFSPREDAFELVYKVAIKSNTESYDIKLSFDDFAKIYSKIHLSYPNKRLPPFPTEKTLNSLDFLAKSKAKVDKFLQFIVSDKDLKNSPFITKFLNLDNSAGLVDCSILKPNIDVEKAQTDELKIQRKPELRAIKSLYQLSENTKVSSNNTSSSNTISESSRKTKARAPANVLFDSEQNNSSSEKQLKRSRNNGTKAMRKRFGFRRGIQVVDKASLPNLQSAAIGYPDGVLKQNSFNEAQNNYFLEMSGGLNTMKAHLNSFAESDLTVAGPKASDSEDSEEFELDKELLSRRSHKVGLDDFHLISVIGKGTYGNVMLARHKDTAKVYAIKAISKKMLLERPGDVNRVMAERHVLKKVIHHPFLVGLEYAFQTKSKLYFCLDYINGGELFYHLQLNTKFAENRARFYAAEIVSAIGYLHSLGIIYRDLKPENCLLDSYGHIKIVDFGLAKIFDTSDGIENSKAQTFCGTPEYLAPEVILRQPYGKEIDWYCLGAILYEMVIGLPPFYSNNKAEIYNNIISQSLTFPNVNNQPIVGQLTKDFISRLMVKQPSSRLGYGINGTVDVKNHLYFYGISWEKIYNGEYQPPFVPKSSSIFELDNISPEFRNEPIPKSILNDGNLNLASYHSCDNIRSRVNDGCGNCTSINCCSCLQNTSLHKSNFSYFSRHSHSQNGGNNDNSLLQHNMKENHMTKLGNGSNISIDETVDAFRGFSFDSVRC